MTAGGHTITNLVAGRFRLVERLGSGGMGTVWRAFDTSIGVERALKEIRIPDHVSLADREMLVERARREARNAARLGVHPHVVTVHGLVEDAGAHWIVMDLIQGRSLASIITADGALSEREVARIGIALLDALSHGHRKGVLHRDVKPSNVLVTPDGTVRLADFGVAVYETDHPITAAGGVVGTPAYMAPERIRGGREGPASDLFSLATTLFHAVEGVSPFGRDTTFATMHAVVYEGPGTPVRAARTYSVLRPILAKEPSARPTADRIRQQLQMILAAPEASPAPRPAPSSDAWPTSSAFYEAPTIVSLEMRELRAGLETGRLKADIETTGQRTHLDVAGRRTGAVGRATDDAGHNRHRGVDQAPAIGEEIDTIGLDLGPGGAPEPRPAQLPHDVDPATIEQPVWISPGSTGDAHQSGAAGPRGPGPSRRGLLLAGVAAAGLGVGGGSAAWAARRLRGRVGQGAVEARLTPLTFGLPRPRDAEFAGSFLADHRGYYRTAGFARADFRDPGPQEQTVAASVASGAVLVGVADPETLVRGMAGGALLKVIGAQQQKSPWAVASLPDRPIRSPQEMIGAKIGMTADSTILWRSFLLAVGVAESDVTQIVVTDNAQALADRQVDGALSHMTDIPLAFKRQGVDISTFLLADHGFSLVGNSYFVTADTVRTSREKIKGFLAAEIRGWKDNLADPESGARVLTDVYAASGALNATTELEKNRALNALVLTAETRRNGLFTMTDALMEANVRALSAGASSDTAQELFDLSVIRELYVERPDLI